MGISATPAAGNTAPLLDAPSTDRCSAFDPGILKQTPLFGGMNEECRCVLTDRMEERHYAAGATIYTQGEQGRELYILVAGQADVLKNGQSLGPLRHADFFGEASFLDMGPRPHTVVVKEDVTVYAIPYPALLSLYQHNVRAFALIMMNLAREMSRRLRCADELACKKAQG